MHDVLESVIIWTHHFIKAARLVLLVGLIGIDPIIDHYHRIENTLFVGLVQERRNSIANTLHETIDIVLW